ncbi:hypothetical protein D7X98_18580 [bacterium 1XD8-76]|nr:hypothetical protein D7X98_18580 [bacterium 1XD8-76]
MEKWKKVLPLAVMGFLLTGCGTTTAEVTTIAILKDGTIEHTLVEDFGEESVDALQSMMLEKTAAYNKNNADGEIAVKTVEEEDGIVKVVMSYPDAAAFDGFMNMDVVEVDPALRAPFFYGTVEEAFMEGYDLEITLQGVESEEVLQGKNDLLAKGEKKIIIYDNEMNLGAPVQISLQEKPAYVSDNVTMTGKKLVEISGEDEMAYILME